MFIDRLHSIEWNEIYSHQSKVVSKAIHLCNKMQYIQRNEDGNRHLLCSEISFSCIDIM